MSTEDHEQRLIAAAVLGDQDAFAELVSPMRDKLWSACMRICGNAHDAEDALQDTLIATWRNLDRFGHRSSFSTWAYRIAVNASLAVVRRQRDVLMADPAEFVRTSTSFEDGVVAHDTVQVALDAVPDVFRVCLVLREICGFSYQEIADHQGIPVQTVRSRIHRARQALAATP